LRGRCVHGKSQPINNQRYAATKREQTRLIFTLFVNVFGVFRRTITAHNGLVAGSSPAEPTNEINPGASAYLNCAGVTRSVVRWNSLFC
jgi:hypothetical protein